MRDLATITDIIRQSVSAVEAGRELGLRPDRHGRCACPVHNGKDRNCKLYDGDRGFHCFVCSAHEDVIGLVRSVQGCSFLQAVEWLNSAFHLALPLDRPLDKAAQDAAEIARNRKRMEREQRRAVERMKFDLYTLCVWWLGKLEQDKEQYRPRTAEEEWDERFVTAVRLIPEVKELADQLAVEVIGAKQC